MRNKKYRQWMSIIILSVFIIIAVVGTLLTQKKGERIFLIVAGTSLVVINIIISFLYFEIQSDRVVVRQGVFSRNRAYESNFKKRVFMFDDIKDIEVEGKKVLRIYLKDGYDVGISIMGCIRKNEIIGLIYEVRAQIKGYEQQYI